MPAALGLTVEHQVARWQPEGLSRVPLVPTANGSWLRPDVSCLVLDAGNRASGHLSIQDPAAQAQLLPPPTSRDAAIQSFSQSVTYNCRPTLAPRRFWHVPRQVASRP